MGLHVEFALGEEAGWVSIIISFHCLVRCQVGGLVGGVRSWQGCFIWHLGDYGRAGNGSGTVRCVEYRE